MGDGAGGLGVGFGIERTGALRAGSEASGTLSAGFAGPLETGFGAGTAAARWTRRLWVVRLGRGFALGGSRTSSRLVSATGSLTDAAPAGPAKGGLEIAGSK